MIVRADDYREILVVDLLGGLGDLIMVLPVIHALARRHPRAAVRVLTHSPGADLVRHDPAVASVHTPARRGAGAERAAVADALARRPPDLAVSTTRYDGIPDLLTASGARSVTDLWRRPPPDEPVTRRYLRILRAEGLVGDPDVGGVPDDVPRLRLLAAERAEGDRVLRGHLSGDGRPPVVLVGDAGMAVKRWPRRRWVQLSGLLRAAGHPVLAVPPAPCPEATALPPTDLRGLAGTFAAVGGLGGVVVGGDTGPVRLAAAAGAATVALFGPTLATRYGVGGVDLQGLPTCPHRRPTAITEQVCWWQARCPLSAVEPACLADIPAGEVAGAVLRLTRHRSH